MDALEAIQNRRSVRQYTGENIPREDILKIIDAGRMAATGGNQQPWEFIVVTDRGLIDALKIAADWMVNAACIVAVVMDPQSRWWVEDGSAAIENILIAATALGYGSCWLEGWTLPREDEFKKLLSIPDERRLLTLIPIGVPVGWPTRQKKPVDEILYWEHYGQK